MDKIKQLITKLWKKGSITRILCTLMTLYASLVWCRGSNKTVLAKRVLAGQGQCVLGHDWINLHTEVTHFNKAHILFSDNNKVME